MGVLSRSEWNMPRSWLKCYQLHCTALVSEPPPERFTGPGLTRNSSFCRTALEHPSIHQVFFFAFFPSYREERGFSCSALKPRLRMHPFAARKQGVPSTRLRYDTSHVFYDKQDEQSTFCIALSVGEYSESRKLAFSQVT